MKLSKFISAIDELVLKWNNTDSLTPRKELEAIYNDVREQAVWDLAEAVRQREAATRTHGMLITIDRKSKQKGITNESQPDRSQHEQSDQPDGHKSAA